MLIFNKLFSSNKLVRIVEHADYISVDCVNPYRNELTGYDTDKCNGEAPVLKLWGMWSTSSLPLLPGSLWNRVMVPVRVP